ncbi:MAG: exodeoxyribonuclease VII large subunit [Candidatus Omnitrophica bacterium]|nr:exodeoxyribonuclease VII large subunit [Candidatus Omnitrophota bacterium]
MNKNSEIFTVSQINNYIKGVINAAFPQPLWICGEIQGYDRNRMKSHVFFELVEKDERSETIVSKIGLVLFDNRKAMIDHVLRKSENSFSLKDDIEVKFACRIDFYPPHGAMRLIVEDIDPTYTLGKVAQQKQKIIALLKEKGVLEKNKKTELVPVPLNIGLITSDNSAAYNDFVSELGRSGYAFQVYVRNTIMQGSKTEKDVIRAIDQLQKINDLDVIVITRGGGSIADLADFDSQLIAEKIGECRLPVLSGIGHEINISITDMAAHTYAKTPTAIAHFLVKLVEGYINILDEKRNRLLDESKKIIRDQKQALKDCSIQLQNCTNYFLKSFNQQLIEFKHSLSSRPYLYLKESQKVLLDRKLHVLKIVHGRLDDEKIRLTHCSKMVDIVNPVNTLKRGFSLTRRADGQIVRSADDVKQAEQIITYLAEGSLMSEIKIINREKNSGGN